MSETGKKKKSGKKIALIIILSVLAVLVIGGIGIGVAVSKIASAVSSPVEVAYPLTGDISSSVNTSGVVTSGTMVSYTTNVSAVVDELKVRQGEIVKQGDLLMTFDVTSLEEQLDQAALNARSTQLNGQSTIESSNRTSNEIDKAKKRIDELNGQIATKKDEIAALTKDIPVDTTRAELESTILEKRDRYTAVLEEIQVLVDAYPAGSDISVDPVYINKCAERDALNSSIENLETILKEMPDSSASVSSMLEVKNNELVALQTELANQQAIVSSGEAGLLTNTQREQLNIANQLSNMQVQSATTMLEEGRAGIKADQNGIITSINITEGAAASPGYQLITIADMDDMKVRVSLSKNEIEKVSIGQKATVTALGKEYEGEVTYISHMAETNASGGTAVETEISIKNPDKDLIIGLDAKVVIHTAEVHDVMMVSNMSVNMDTDGIFVYAVENNILVKKYIKIGAADVNHTEVLEGLDSDTMVVSTISSKLVEGSIVTTTMKDEDGNTLINGVPVTGSTEAKDSSASEDSETTEE